MKKFIHTLCYIIDLYIYFIAVSCFLTFIPFLNVNFPAIKIMFWLAGFGMFSAIPILNMFSPLILLITLISLRKLLYKIIGENDKFLGYDTALKPKNNDIEKDGDKDNGNEDTDSTGTNN